METKIKCTCKGVEQAAKEKYEKMKKANSASFIAKQAENEVLHGAWEKCTCSASKMLLQGQWKIYADEKPGDQFRDPEDKNISILMMVIVDLDGKPVPFYAKWSYSVDCFMSIHGENIIGPETFAFRTRLWSPAPIVTERLWNAIKQDMQQIA